VAVMSVTLARSNELVKGVTTSGLSSDSLPDESPAGHA
jgi:hypothetical protein